MRFEIRGEFEAEGIDDAFQRLAEHFAALAAGDEDSDIVLGGEYWIEVAPLARPGVP